MIDIDFGKYTKISTSPLISKAKDSILILDDIKNQMESAIPPFDTSNVNMVKDLSTSITQLSVNAINHATDGILNSVNCVLSKLGYNQIDLFNLIQQLTNKLINGNHMDGLLDKLNELKKLFGFWNEIDKQLKKLASWLSGLQKDILDISNLLSKINELYDQSIGILSWVASIAKCFPGSLGKDVDYALDYMDNMKKYIEPTAGDIMTDISDKLYNNVKIDILNTSKQFIDSKLDLQSQFNNAYNKIYDLINKI